MLRSIYIVQSQIISLGDEPFNIRGSLRKQFRSIFNSTTCFQDNRLSIYDFYRVNGSPYSIHKREGYPVTHAPFIKKLGQVCFSTKQAFHVVKAYEREELAILISGKVDYWNSDPQCETADMEQYNSCFFGYNQDTVDQRMNFLYFELRPPLTIDIRSKEETIARGKLFIHFHPCGYVGLHLAVSLTENIVKSSKNIFQLIKETRPGRKGNSWMWESKLGELPLQGLIKSAIAQVSSSMYEDGTLLKVDDKGWSSSVSVVSDNNVEDLKEEMFHEPPFVLKMNSTIGVEVVKEQMLVSPQGHLFLNNPIRKRQSVLHSFWRILHIHEFVLLKKRIYEDYYIKIQQRSSNLAALNLSKNVERRQLDYAYDPKIRIFLMELDRIIKGAEPFYRAAYTILSKGMRLNELRDKLTVALKEWEEKLQSANEMERLRELTQLRVVIEGDTYINLGQVASMGTNSVSIGNEFILSSGPNSEVVQWKSEYLKMLQEVIKVLEGRPKEIYGNWPDVVKKIRSIVRAGEQGNEESLKEAICDWREWVEDMYKDEKRKYALSIESITKSSSLKKLLNLHKKVKF